LDVLFDCSQFIAIERKLITDKIKLNVLSGIWNHRVIDGSDIEEKTKDFLKKNLSITNDFVIYEFIDKEFLGDFEDWADGDVPSIKIQCMEKCVEYLLKMGIVQVELLLISSAHENCSIHQANCKFSDIRQNLFVKSLKYFGEGAYSDIIVLSVKI